MNNIFRTVFRGPSFRSMSNIIRQSPSESLISNRKFTRNLWHMSKMNETNKTSYLGLLKVHNQSSLCSCGCNRKNHTSGEKELADFLKDEIAAEKELLKSKTLPSEVKGFKVQLDGSEVSLTKTVGDQTIEVMFCVNHSVDAEAEPEISPTMDKPEFGEMVSKPEFEIEIKRGNVTLGLTCSFIQNNAQQEEEYNDLFSIEDVVLYEGEWKENNYAVSGAVLDGYLYDILMNFLADKGISNEFVEELSKFSTNYEHNLYISFLEGLRNFASK